FLRFTLLAVRAFPRTMLFLELGIAAEPRQNLPALIQVRIDHFSPDCPACVIAAAVSRKIPSPPFSAGFRSQKRTTPEVTRSRRKHFLNIEDKFLIQID